MMRSTAMPAILFALLLIPCGAQALPGDEQKPIEIEADRAELDDATGTATYSGSVRLDQGSLKVRAARLIIETDAQQVQRITAEGDREKDLLARYEQTPEPGAEPVRAQAQTIIYYTDAGRIELLGAAQLEQAEDRFEGDVISYDLTTRKVAASAGADGAPVRMVIEPARLRSPRGAEAADSDEPNP